MRTVRLPGQRRVEIGVADDPVPGHGQVVLAVGASTICGSDLRAIYREHLGTGAEAYAGVVAGHEPSGTVVAVGPGVLHRRVGDRVVVYHISGCGLCEQCRAGYRIACTSPERAAYGWQRDGGHADLLLADEADLLTLPDELSFVDGACVACGFGTAYEALVRAGVSGRDDVVVTGLGPVGQAVGLLARALGAPRVVGVDLVAQRRERALEIGAVTHVVDSDPSRAEQGAALADVRDALGGAGASVSVDASGAGPAQALALSGHRALGAVRAGGRGRPPDAGRQPGADPPEHHPDGLVGDLHGAHGRAAGAPAGVGPAPRGGGHRPLRARATPRTAYAVADAGTSGKVAIVPSSPA